MPAVFPFLDYIGVGLNDVLSATLLFLEVGGAGLGWVCHFWWIALPFNSVVSVLEVPNVRFSKSDIRVIHAAIGNLRHAWILKFSNGPNCITVATNKIANRSLILTLFFGYSSVPPDKSV